MDFLDYALASNGKRLAKRVKSLQETKVISASIEDSESVNPPSDMVQNLSDTLISPQKTMIPMQGDLALAATDGVQLPKAKPTVRLDDSGVNVIRFADRTPKAKGAKEKIRENY